MAELSFDEFEYIRCFLEALDNVLVFTKEGGCSSHIITDDVTDYWNIQRAK